MIEKYGFVYIWYDKKHKRFYIGSHWGTEIDGYVCSSTWMKQAYKRRPQDFKRRILKRVYTSRLDLLNEEQRWLDMINDTEMATRSLKEGYKIRYYNVTKQTSPQWHHYENKRKQEIKDKIGKYNKGKNTGPRDPSVGKAISEAKKKSFQNKRETLGYSMSPEARLNMGQSLKGRKHTPEWKAEQSKRTKQMWLDGTLTPKPAKPKPAPKQSYNGEYLKKLWANPEWKANQIAKLKIGRNNRPLLSEETKRKISLAQKGKPKPRRSINIQKESVNDLIN